MENSSKFIILVGTILLSVFLVSSFVYVFRAGARVSKSVDEEQATQQRILENSRFEFYNRGSMLIDTSDEQNTIVDMVSLINLVYANNKDGYDTDRIELEIELPNGKIFIPKDVSGLERNTVFYNAADNKISVYDLLQNTIYTRDGDLLTATKLVDSNTGANTKYKYIFPIKEFKYNTAGKVSTMKFNCKSLSL